MPPCCCPKDPSPFWLSSLSPHSPSPPPHMFGTLGSCRSSINARISGRLPGAGKRKYNLYIYLYRDKLVQSSGNHGLSPSQMHAFPFQGLQNQDNLSTSPWEHCPQVPPCPWLQEEQGGCSWPWRSCTKPHTTVPCPPTKAFRGEKLGREMSAHNTS